MALTEERTATLLAYCHLTELADDPEVQVLIPMFYDAAVSYMEDAGVSEPAEDSPRKAKYDLCINAMVLDSWDHRDTAGESTLTENPAFRRRLNQLKLTEPGVFDSSTSE